MMKLSNALIKTLEINHSSADLLNNKGNAFYKANKFEEANYYYDKALKINAKFKEVWNNKGNAYAKMVKFDTNAEGQNYRYAKESYEKAIEIDDEYYTAYNNFALLDVIESKIFENKGKLQDAKEHIEKSYKIKSDNPETLDNYGVVYYHLKDYDKALEFFNRAKEKDNKSAIIMYHIGRTNVKKENYIEALSCFDKSLDIEPKFAEAYNGLAFVYNKLKDFNKAIKYARKALEIKPELEVADYNLGKLASSDLIKKHGDFWEFWTSSPFKKLIVLVILLLTFVFVSLYAIHIFGFFNLNEVTTTNTTTANKIVNTTILTNSGRDVPETYFIIIGVLLFILLLPEIRKAKMGPVEFELDESDKHHFENEPSPSGQEDGDEEI